MLHIKVLGSGCAKCKQLFTLVEQTVAACGLEATIEKVEDMADIMQYDLLATPALVVEEEVLLAGTIPSQEELQEMLQNHQNKSV